jgi:Resolvase, N terminal domain
MTDLSKVRPAHTQRAAYVYIRQSTPGQVEHNRESTARQYALAERACQLGWRKEQVVLIDEDLGLSGASTDKRSGFTRLTSEVALARVGIVLGLEVSRLARNNADWYRLIELCGIWPSSPGDLPRGPHRSGREPLDSSGSCHRLKAAAFRQDRLVPPVAG